MHGVVISPMDHNLTLQLKKWLETPEAERDYNEGALLMLRLSGNKILYRNVVTNIDRRHDVVEYQLQKYYNFRVKALTHAQVEEMATAVDAIAKERRLEDADAEPEPKQLGRRADHDKLPDDVQACFVENLSILHRMRELHLKLRTMSLDDVTCPDSERYPFLKELIDLDKKMHSNWETYDTYVTPKATKTKRKVASTTKKS